jgi:hypothetical protein
MTKWTWILAAAGALTASPCDAGDLDSIGRDSTQFFVRIPLGRASSAKDLEPTYGLAIRGRRDYELFVVDTRMLRQAEVFGAGIDAKILIVGGVAAAAAVVASRSDSSAEQKREDQQQQAQQQQQAKSCPKTPPTC